MTSKIWSDAYLTQLINDAEKDISRQFATVFTRFTLAITSGTAIYSLPDYIREISRVTWKGRALQPFNFSSTTLVIPQDFSQTGEPQFYVVRGDDLSKIRLIPIPNESLAADDSGVFGPSISTTLAISAYREPDISGTNFQIPDYIARRTVKAYVLWKAFLKEGLGQNLKAAIYYETKYRELISAYNTIRSSYFNAKERLVGLNLPSMRSTLTRPQLGSNFFIPKPLRSGVSDDLDSWSDSVGITVI